MLEVDRWTNFTRHFTHLKSAEPATDRSLLLTAFLADALNLGLEKMAEACPGTSFGTVMLAFNTPLKRLVAGPKPVHSTAQQ